MKWIESQIEMRAKLDAQAAERAYAKLAASVTDGREAPRADGDDLELVDGAARACLRYCGVEPGEVPDGVADADERLDYLCRPTGTMRRKVRLDGDWFKQAFGALLGTLDTGEAVALIPRGVRGYGFTDPATGRSVRVNAATAKHIRPEAVFFYRPLPACPLAVRDLAAFMMRVFDRWDYAAVFAAALAATLVGLFPAWANQIAFGVVVPSGQDDLIAPIGALLVGVAVSTVIINACRNLVMQRVALKMDVAAEAAVFARVMSLPPSFFKRYAGGDLGMRVSQVSMLTQQLSSLILGSALTCALSVVYIIQIGVYAQPLVVPALVVVAAQAGFTVFAALITARYERATMDENAKLSGTVTALLGGVQKIKLAGAEERAFARWADGYAGYARYAYNRPAFVRATSAIVTLIGLLGTIAIYFYAGLAQVSVADYMSFNVAFGQMTAAVMALAAVAGQFAQIGPMMEIVAPILEATPEVAEGRPSVGELSGAVEVSNVSFRYNDDGPYVLQDLSFSVRPGEYVGIVGRSGCGKSTILRLLLGFEEPERGSVFYGPHDVRKVDLRSLRSHIGTVMQDGRLFMGDIASNITISAPSATLDDAWEAAELAGIADDIRKMPMGMQTLVTEGSGGVSGGQRQRIMIARAVCGNRRILMFDEATSALDNITQKHVADSLESLNCTRIVVAHRLSTVRHCDRILVIDGGRVAEEGTYEELIAREGAFAELVARQLLDGEGLGNKPSFPGRIPSPPRIRKQEATKGAAANGKDTT
ncbi:MAG: ATP-binding cassette domain-containing protein [Eggerthellaceae bacterium]|nr:ATP-binding cassette domain-containing protein [Eggerthellaceae bacterium]